LGPLDRNQKERKAALKKKNQKKGVSGRNRIEKEAGGVGGGKNSNAFDS